MSGSSKLTCAATEPLLSPIVTVRSADDGGRATSPSRDGGDNEECRTPTSEESKLASTPLNCPPAPRKRRRVAICRRRRRPWSAQVELIVVGAEELEQLFQWREQPPRHAKKQRRLSGEDK